MEYKRVTKRLENGTPCIDCKALGCEYFDYGCEMDYNCCERAAAHLAELEDAIEQGKMIELPKMPFEIGQTAYWLNGLPNCIQEYKVRGYSVGRLGLRIDLGDFEPLLYKVFGERLFCSREEAEKKLKELQK